MILLFSKGALSYVGLACDQANAMYSSSPSIHIFTPGGICTICIDYLFKNFNYGSLHIKMTRI